MTKGAPDPAGASAPEPAPLDPPTGVMGRLRPLVPYVLTAALFMAGVWALYHLLRPIDLASLMAELRGIPIYLVALSIACTAISYGALIGYDWSALRYLGKSLPPRAVITGGFLGYALSNTIGAGPVTGGLVRYRIYASLGLTAFDVAGIAAFIGVSFGVGITLIGFGALAWHPEAVTMVTDLDAGLIRTLALAVLGVCLAGLVIVARRRTPIAFRGRDIVPPTGRVMALQLVFTAIDIVMAAATLYLLLPAGALPFAPFLAVFSAGILAGVISNVPGGIGVFEIVIIAAMPATMSLEQVAAALVLYRLIHFLLPFVIATILLAVIEARSAGLGRFVPGIGPLADATRSITPIAMSAMVFGSGVFMLTAPLIPPLSEMSRRFDLLLPLAFLESGALVSSSLGAVLVVLAHGLLRRAYGAWWLACAALAAGVVASLARGVDVDRAVLLTCALVILLASRTAFYRTTRLTRDVLGLRWVLLMASLAVTLTAVLFFAHKATPYSHEMWWQFAADQSAPRALRAALVGGLALALLSLVLALRPGRVTHGLATPDDLDRAAKILRAQDDPFANIALTGDKSILFSETGRSFLMYRIRNRSWIALHAPVGDPAELAELGWAFKDAAEAANARPVFYAVPASSVPLWLDMGLALFKMGEEAVVRLDQFSLEGGQRRRLRTTHNRALRDGLRFDVIPAPVPPEVMARLGQISDDWLAAKAGGEKGFSVGRFDAHLLAQAPVATITLDGRIVAFANIWQTDTRKKATIDLMRHVDDAPSGVMEFLFTELLLHFKAEGFDSFSLGNAPLSGLETRPGAPVLTRLGAFVFRHGRHFYNFEGLRTFKSKFDPDWHPVYIAVPARGNLVGIATDLVSLISGGLGRGVGIDKAMERVPRLADWPLNRRSAPPPDGDGTCPKAPLRNASGP